jgi:hypothetical protein
MKAFKNIYNFQFQEGELLTVGKLPRHISTVLLKHNFLFPAGPRIKGYQTLHRPSFKEGRVYLAVSNTQKSSWRDNYKLCVDIMFEGEIATVWCDLFKKKRYKEVIPHG